MLHHTALLRTQAHTQRTWTHTLTDLKETSLHEITITNRSWSKSAADWEDGRKVMIECMSRHIMTSPLGGDMSSCIWNRLWSEPHSRYWERKGPQSACTVTWGVTRQSQYGSVCWILTCLNFEREGVLLLDGVCEKEASVAAVVIVSVFGQHVGEVQVSVQTHGHSLVLKDRRHRWNTAGSRGKEIQDALPYAQ